ncbi:MAG: transketolase [Myxococcota bacterium]|jgi:transketolase
MSDSVASDSAAIAVNTIKGLAMDAIQKANSGHPGMPMGMADAATVLWSQFLRFDPAAPNWPDRDRFVLSAGHGSMLLYALLHLTGYEDMTMDELKSFRQWGAKTAGHPEFGFAGGIETTTGPLGQGISNAVGMALAEKLLAGRFNSDAATLVDHYTYVIAGDGDLMEGVANEAASLAGHLQLSKLVVLYDDNEITIDGGTELSFTEDVCGRFDAMAWHTVKINGHDHVAVADAIRAAQADGRPSLIACRTQIGQGSPNKQGTSSAHGSPLGDAEIALTKQGMGWPEEAFYVPEEARTFWAAAAERAEQAHHTWRAAREAADSETLARFDACLAETIPAGTWDKLPTFEPGAKLATRKASQAVLNAICDDLPWLIGGSADLAGSNGTTLKAYGKVTPTEFGADRRNMCWGVREHGMAAAMNGMALHGGARPYSGTFLVFSDYMRPSVRLAALMHQPVIHVWTHDSVFLGEDGPTHQPVEHAMALRMIPNLHVIRPADANETAAAWQHALERTTGPSGLLLTRQGLPNLAEASREGALKGGYVIRKESGDAPDVVLMASGSEVHVALDSATLLAAQGIDARVVSIPCFGRFDEQTEAYRSEVLSSCKRRVAIEAGRTWGWEKYTGTEGTAHGIDTFGVSAPADVIAEKWGFTPKAFAALVSRYLESFS